MEDVFSQYIFLRPLKKRTKTSDEVARELDEIYQTFGPPRILQSDQGPEFKGGGEETDSMAECESHECTIISLSHKER